MNGSAIVVLLVAVLALYTCEAHRECDDPNETWTDCGSHCEPSCLRSEPRACILSCKLDVCQCNRGYYRAPNGRCVDLRECRHYRYGKHQLEGKE